MIQRNLVRFLKLPTLAILLGTALTLCADTLSDNLTQPTDGTDAITGDLWSAAGFSTPSSAYTLTSVTLLMDQYAPGAAELALFSDSNDMPGSLLGMLQSPASYSPSPSAAIFEGNSLSLAANTNYWVVLWVPSGGFDWAFAATSTGSGSGFNSLWSSSFDGGATWATFATLPYQMSVQADATTATPEPTTTLLLAVGAGILFAFTKAGVRL